MKYEVVIETGRGLKSVEVENVFSIIEFHGMITFRGENAEDLAIFNQNNVLYIVKDQSGEKEIVKLAKEIQQAFEKRMKKVYE